MITPQRIRRSAAQWREILQRFSESGLPATAFCERNKIAYGTFVRWRHTLSRPEAAPAADMPSTDWLPIHVTDSIDAPERTWEIDLKLPGGVQLRMRAT